MAKTCHQPIWDMGRLGFGLDCDCRVKNERIQSIIQRNNEEFNQYFNACQKGKHKLYPTTNNNAALALIQASISLILIAPCVASIVVAQVPDFNVERPIIIQTMIYQPLADAIQQRTTDEI